MKENVLDVLMYLFENYYMDEDPDANPSRESLHSELMEVGFPNVEIDKAFEWLESLSEEPQPLPAAVCTTTQRVYTREECERLDLESRGFLMFLEQRHILTPGSRERVLERVMALDTDGIDIEQLKWVILMVLFNEPGQEAAYAWMEDLVVYNYAESLH